jgi:hypothetical protein
MKVNFLYVKRFCEILQEVYLQQNLEGKGESSHKKLHEYLSYIMTLCSILSKFSCLFLTVCRGKSILLLFFTAAFLLLLQTLKVSSKRDFTVLNCSKSQS